MTRRTHRMKTVAVSVFILAVGFWVTRLAIYQAFSAHTERAPMPPGDCSPPSERGVLWHEKSELTEQILKHWARRPLGDWQTEGKIDAPRASLARFLLNRDLDAANAYLNQQQPWGIAGSTWAGNPNGDYDFTLAGLTPILFLFGDSPEVLYPKTLDHLLGTLLTLEGGTPLLTVPGTLGMVPDTENHLLMTEGSRYLKNHWLATHGSDDPAHDNVANGLEEWLLDLINNYRAAGLYEFNSIPYEGYTITALLNLEAFGASKVQAAARDLIDHLNWKYAIGSFRFRRFPPFRRQYKHANDTALDGDRQTGLVKTWMSLFSEGPKDLTLKNNWHVAIWSCWSPYRLPDETARWMIEKPNEYFACLGHGRNACPEIYSGGPSYLLTAGGVNRGEGSLIVARPITLIVNDDAKKLNEVLHLAGPSNDFREWNNTGVWQKFAVAAGPVSIPTTWQAAAQSKLWRVFQRDRELCVVVHSSENLGIVHLVHSSDPAQVLSDVQDANPSQEELRKSFQIPNGTRIDYDVNAPHDEWVIRQIDDRLVNRAFDDWPQADLWVSSDVGSNGP